MSQPKLYTLPGSHPGHSAALMLTFKGIDFKRVDLLPVISKGALRLVGFDRVTVPALKIGGEKIQGSVAIARGLDRLLPDPPLLPTDPDRREAVLEAERFGDEELQHPIRQIIYWLLKRDGSSMGSYLEGSRIGLPTGLAWKTGRPLVTASAHFNRADDEHVKEALSRLPELLDRVDGYVEAGVIGGDTPNAADFQIAPSIRLALTMEDLRPAVEDRPIAAMARRILPDYPGSLPTGLPEEWLKPLRAGSPAA